MQNPWATFPGNQSSDAISFVSSPHPALNRFLLPNGEHVTCAYWNGLFQITGTDIGESPPRKVLGMMGDIWLMLCLCVGSACVGV